MVDIYCHICIQKTRTAATVKRSGPLNKDGFLMVHDGFPMVPDGFLIVPGGSW